MLRRIGAELVLGAHFAFAAFVLFGGVLALSSAAWAWVHLPAVAWAALMNFADWTCPLTPLEKRLRREAGGKAYEGDFVQHYFGSLAFPRITSRQAELATASTLLTWNALIYAFVWYART